MGNVISIIFIVAIIAAILGGIFGGFGKVIVFLTKGILGKILAGVICYSVFGFVLNLGFVVKIQASITNALNSDPGIFKKILLLSRIDLIAVAVGLYFVVRLLLKLLAKLVDTFMSAQNKVMKILNKTLGVVLAVGVMMIFLLIIFQIMYWISGPTGGVFRALRSSFLRLDRLYLNNPLHSIIQSFKR